MHPDLLWRAVLGGSGELDCELRGLASELGLSKRIHFAGWVADKADFFSSIDLFVLPSRDEPFGIVVIEAARYGIPIVATRCHGPLDIIDDGQDGLLVDIEDPKELAQQLYCLIMDPVSAQALAHNAYAKMAQRYSRQVVGRQLSSTLKELVAGWNQ
jgi:glycosyltransferase involved in cell wall biosynthesis